MDPVHQASWLSAAPAVVLALALLYAPGLLVARTFRLDPIAAAGLAPALGLFALLTSATAVSASGLDWTVLTGGAALLVTTLLLAGAGRLVVRGTERSPRCWSGRQLLAFGAACVGAAGATGWALVSGTQNPDALAQMPDAPFHLIAVRDLVEARSANPWVSGDTLWYVPGSRYPGGFHSIAATVAAWSGADVDVACHAVLAAFTAVVWPVSMVALVWVVVARSGWLLLGAAALAVATTFSALSMMPVGAAWANATSTALLPGLLVPLAVAVRDERAPTARQVVVTAVLVVTTTAAAALCQPNAVFGLALLGLPLVAPRLVSWGRAWAACWVLAVLGAVLVWVALFPASSLDVPVSGEPDPRRALLVVLKGGDLPLWAGGAVAALTAVGLLVSARRPIRWGVALAWSAGFVLLSAVVFDTGLPVQRLTWPWYSGQARIAPVFAIVAVLAASCGIAWGLDIVRIRAGRWRTPAAAAIVAVLAVVALPGVPAVRDAVRFGYVPADPAFTYVTEQEVAALEQLADEIPEDGATALDPFRGGMYLGMFGRRTIPVTPFSTTSELGEVVDRELDAALDDPEVCDAVRRLGLTNVLTGGSRAKYWSSLGPAAPGVDAVPGAPGFTEVASFGPYVLWQVPADCRA